MPEAPAVPFPRPVNHIGLTVPDIFAAIDWYRDVLGFTHIMGPRVLEAGSAATHETPSIFGPRFRKAYQAHMLSGNGVGLELFQFIEPAVERRPDNFEYWMAGVFHICVTDPNVEALARRIVESGGRQRVPVFEFIPGRPYKLVYCEDPWQARGNSSGSGALFLPARPAGSAVPGRASDHRLRRLLRALYRMGEVRPEARPAAKIQAAARAITARPHALHPLRTPSGRL